MGESEGLLEHGGRLRAAARHYGIAEADWLDLSSGIAPWPWPLPSIPQRAWARLPETDDGLEQAAQGFYGAAQVLPVAGSQAAIQLLPRLRPAAAVGVLSPCYAEHARAWRQAGHQVHELPESQVEAWLERLQVLVLVNPNNPTGRRLPPEQLLDWHARLANRGGWLVVDEAFMDSTPAFSLAGHSQLPGLIVLRSFGKFFGLAGLRLGFVLAEAPLLRRLAAQLGPWTLSGPARWVGQVCLRDLPGHQVQAARAAAASHRLGALLAQHGLAPDGGCDLFQWCTSARAEALQVFLARRGILLRLFNHPPSLRFGLPPDEAGWQRLEQGLHAFTEALP